MCLAVFYRQPFTLDGQWILVVELPRPADIQESYGWFLSTPMAPKTTHFAYSKKYQSKFKFTWSCWFISA